MITKGIIKSIDLLGNTCTVHIPFFETAGNDPIIETATVSNTPGSYNGYKVGDVVYVAFEDGSMSNPVVIGKLYLGTEKEKADPRGVSNVEESTAAKKATLPADSKLTAELDSNVPNTTVPYSSLSSIANGLNKLNTDVAQNDRDYGNRFKQVFSDTNGLKSTIEQTAREIRQEVFDENKDIRSELKQTADKLVASVSGYETDADGDPILDKPTAFGWNLQKNSWSVFNQDKTILTADAAGLHVTGRIDAESGHIANFLIKDTGIVSYTTSTAEDGKETETPWITNFTNSGQELSASNGVYVGTDGIRLGANFSVDTSGIVTATELVLKPENVYLEEEEIGPETGRPRRCTLKKRIEEGDTATETLKEILNQNLTNGEDITSTKITNEVMLSPYLIVDAANIRKALTIGDIDKPLFHADIDNPAVTIGGFEVSDSGIYSTGFGSSYSAAGSKESGIYVGTDGIKLGKNFSVDTTGDFRAKSGTIGNCTIDKDGKLIVPAGNIDGELTAKQINADGLTVTNGDFSGSITTGKATITGGALTIKGASGSAKQVQITQGKLYISGGKPSSSTAVEYKLPIIQFTTYSETGMKQSECELYVLMKAKSQDPGVLAALEYYPSSIGVRELYSYSPGGGTIL